VVNILQVRSNTTASPLTDPYPDNIRMRCKKARKSGERETSLVVCSKRVSFKDTIKSQATYPIPYRVLNITCPLIVRGTSRSIWTSYEEGMSIFSCCANLCINTTPSLISKEYCSHLILPPKGPRVHCRWYRPRPRLVCLKRRACPTFNQNPPCSTPPPIRHSFIYPAHKLALLP